MSTKVTATAFFIAILATSAFAMSETNVTRLSTMGFSKEALKMLSDKDLQKIERALHNGEDSDARKVVNSIILNALMMQMNDG